VWQEQHAAARQQPDLYVTEAGTRQLLCCMNSKHNVAAALLPADRVAAGDGVASGAFLRGMTEQLQANGIIHDTSARANLMRVGAVLLMLLSGQSVGQVSRLVQLQREHMGTAPLIAEWWHGTVIRWEDPRGQPASTPGAQYICRQQGVPLASCPSRKAALPICRAGHPAVFSAVGWPAPTEPKRWQLLAG
jgi:hypothetical protein